MKQMGKWIVVAVVAASAAVSSAESAFKTLGAMIDVSRGRVLTVDAMKVRFDRMKAMGYNAVMLYSEDTYPLPGEPKWGYMRGGYTLDDIRVIKAHADSVCLKMLPCIETLSHLENVLRWREYADVRNTHTTMLVGEERTYELIDKMVAFWANAIGGRRIHVGMDEAFGFAADGVTEPKRLRYLASKPWTGALYAFNSGLPVGPFEIDARQPGEDSKGGSPAQSGELQ